MRSRPRRILALAAAVAVGLAFASPHGAEAAKRKKKRHATAAIPVTPRPPDPNRVTFPTADGVTLAATWNPVPGMPGAPALLLVHEFSRDRREWSALVPELNARGLATLAIDLRAHGESLKKSGATVKLTPRLQSDPNGFPRDVEAACRWLRQRAPKVGVMGLSVGGELAVLATASRWADAAVALSATTSRLRALAGSLPTVPRSTLLVASEDDPGRASAAKELYAAQGEPRQMIVVPGGAHNLALFGEGPKTKAEAYTWLMEKLGAVTPPAPTPNP